MLEARLGGDKEARGLAAAPPTNDKKKKKKGAKLAAVKLEDDVVEQYEKILAQVRFLHYNLNDDQSVVDDSSIIILARKSGNCVEIMT